MASYRYNSLSAQADSIRLLRLLPSPVDKVDIHVELLEYSLASSQQSNHAYEALSYVWGGLDTSAVVFVGDERLPVTTNLHAALLQLRDSTFPRILWVDAVCINQADNVEKALQIQSMAHIYASAKRTIVWLGDEGQGSTEAFDIIRAAGSQVKSSVFDYAAAKINVRSLLQRDWFQRIWVLQEVAAARHVVLCCGSAEIDGHAFCVGLDRLEFVAQNKNRYAPSLAVVTLIRDAIFRPRLGAGSTKVATLGTLPLLRLVNMYNTHHATHRHDKVYALLGMATDDLTGVGLSPDYSIPWEDLMRRLITYFLGEGARADIVPDQEKASIRAYGCIVGHVTGLQRSANGVESMTVKMNEAYVYDYGRKELEAPWFLPALANSVHEGDIVYLLEGAKDPMIVRHSASVLHVVAISITPPAPVRDTGYYRAFPVQWEWRSLPIIPEPVFQYEDNILLYDKRVLGSRWSAALAYLDLSGSWAAETLFRDLLQQERTRLPGARTTETAGATTFPVTITESELVEIIQRIRGRDLIVALLLTSMRHEIDFTPSVFIAVAQWQPEEVLVDLLAKGTDDLPITATTVEAAGYNRSYTEEGIADLVKALHRNTIDKSSLATERLLQVAARNKFAQDLLPLLLARKIDPAEMTDAVLTAAVSNHFGFRKTTLNLLLSHRAHDGPVSDAVLTNAFRSRKCHKDVLQHLLALRGLGRETPEAFWLAAAANRDIDNLSCSGHGEERFRLLRNHELSRKTRALIPITEEVLVAVAESLYNGRAILKFLLQRPRKFAFVDGIATERVMIAAAANTVCGVDVVAELLKAEKDVSAICVTDAVLAAAAANRSSKRSLIVQALDSALARALAQSKV